MAAHILLITRWMATVCWCANIRYKVWSILVWFANVRMFRELNRFPHVAWNLQASAQPFFDQSHMTVNLAIAIANPNLCVPYLANCFYKYWVVKLETTERKNAERLLNSPFQMFKLKVISHVRSYAAAAAFKKLNKLCFSTLNQLVCVLLALELSHKS